MAVAFAIFGATSALVLLAFAWQASRDPDVAQLSQRLRKLSDGTPVEAVQSLWSTPTSGTDPAAKQSKFQAAISALLPAGEADRKDIKKQLLHAGISDPRAMTIFYAMRLTGMLAPLGIYLGLRFGRIPASASLGLLIVALAAIGWITPSFWLKRRITRRQLTLRRSLPDFMDLLIVCLQSGMSVSSALQRVGMEIQVAHPLLAHELEIVQRDVTLGAPVDAALGNFATRSGVDVLRELATFMRESRRFGSEIVDALRTQADTMRYQREQTAEESAQKATVKILFPMLLLILPAIFVVLVGPAVIQIQKAFSR